MSTLTTTLLDFILSLLREPQAAQAFSDHPQEALQQAGLGDVCAADVQALMPMLSDFATPHVSAFTSSGVKPTKENTSPGHSGPEHDSGALAIEHIKFVQANYTVTNTQTLDFSHSVWGTQYNVWADHSQVGVAGGVAVGGDVKDSEIKTANNSGDGAAVGFGNSVTNEDSFNHTKVDGNGNAIGSHAEVTDSHNISDSLNNNGNDIGGGGNVLASDPGNVDAHINDSGNVADHGANSGENGLVDNSETHVNLDHVNVALGEVATAGNDNNTVNDSLGVAQEAHVSDAQAAGSDATAHSELSGNDLGLLPIGGNPSMDQAAVEHHDAFPVH